jgi:hypothetical protein
VFLNDTQSEQLSSCKIMAARFGFCCAIDVVTFIDFLSKLLSGWLSYFFTRPI